MPKQKPFAAYLSPAELKVHKHLIATNAEYKWAVDTCKSPGSQIILRGMLESAVASGGVICSEGVDLEDHAERAEAFAHPPGVYYDVEIQPPEPLRSYVSIEDARNLSEDKLEQISAPIVDWLNKHYQPPAHMRFRVEVSPVLPHLGRQTPLEIWLSTIL